MGNNSLEPLIVDPGLKKPAQDLLDIECADATGQEDWGQVLQCARYTRDTATTIEGVVAANVTDRSRWVPGGDVEDGGPEDTEPTQ